LLKSIARRTRTSLWKWLISKRCMNIEIGKNLKLDGLPYFCLVKDAKLTIGDNVTFTSSTKFNMVGIYKKCTIYVESGAQLSIGDNSGFSGVSIFCSKSISIGKNLTCGGNVSIWDTDFHPLNYLDRRSNKQESIIRKPVIIGNDVFIGASSIVLKGVMIGDRSIIAAGSVISRDIPNDEMWGGNPIRFIKTTQMVS
jgi:acetyltransferase-like isoleucine patch superfamily enzyme